LSSNMEVWHTGGRGSRFRVAVRRTDMVKECRFIKANGHQICRSSCRKFISLQPRDFNSPSAGDRHPVSIGRQGSKPIRIAGDWNARFSVDCPEFGGID
jgi:hypothetical protein